MFLLLLFSFITAGTFEWEEVEGSGAKVITSQIKESSVVKSYGKDVLQKSLTRFDDGIFSTGDKLILPEGAEIIRIPDGLKVKKTPIEILKHERYSIVYEEGALKNEWQRLRKESARELGVSSLENVTPEQISKFMFEKNTGTGTRSRRGYASNQKYPQKEYISFILIEIKGQRELIPVVLGICPIGKLLSNMELN